MPHVKTLVDSIKASTRPRSPMSGYGRPCQVRDPLLTSTSLMPTAARRWYGPLPEFEGLSVNQRRHLSPTIRLRRSSDGPESP